MMPATLAVKGRTIGREKTGILSNTGKHYLHATPSSYFVLSVKDTQILDRSRVAEKLICFRGLPLSYQTHRSF
jgi:hypothetical protein